MYLDYYLYYLSYLHSLYSGYPLIIRLTVAVATVLLCVVLFSILRIFWVGYRIRRDEKRKKEVSEELEEKITFVLRSSTNYDVDEIAALFQYDATKAKKWKSEKVTDLILLIRNELQQGGELNLINYKNSLAVFNLSGFWEKQVRVSGLVKRKRAMQMINVLDGGFNTGLLSKSVFHKNSYLRKIARQVHAEQDNYNPYRFMEENFDEDFTSLDKIRLHAALIKRSKLGKLPDLLRWVHNSKNKQYISFIIQEIGYFKQFEAAPSLLDLLDTHESHDVRIQIIQTFGVLEFEDCVPHLIKRFPLETTAVREAIVEAFGKIRTEKTLQFLLDAYQHTDDDNFRIILVRAISRHEKKGEDSLSDLKQEGRSVERLIIDQIFSERTVVIG